MKAVIFDLDGVLVFTDKLHYKAWKRIADQENIYFDEKINDRLRGVSRAESLEMVLEKSPEHIVKRKRRHYVIRRMIYTENCLSH